MKTLIENQNVSGEIIPSSIIFKFSIDKSIKLFEVVFIKSCIYFIQKITKNLFWNLEKLLSSIPERSSFAR